MSRLDELIEKVDSYMHRTGKWILRKNRPVAEWDELKDAVLEAILDGNWKPTFNAKTAEAEELPASILWKNNRKLIYSIEGLRERFKMVCCLMNPNPRTTWSADWFCRGIALCSPSDEFSRERGEYIATGRALKAEDALLSMTKAEVFSLETQFGSSPVGRTPALEALKGVSPKFATPLYKSQIVKFPIHSIEEWWMNSRGRS